MSWRRCWRRRGSSPSSAKSSASPRLSSGKSLGQNPEGGFKLWSKYVKGVKPRFCTEGYPQQKCQWLPGRGGCFLVLLGWNWLPFLLLHSVYSVIYWKTLFDLALISRYWMDKSFLQFYFFLHFYVCRKVTRQWSMHSKHCSLSLSLSHTHCLFLTH